MSASIRIERIEEDGQFTEAFLIRQAVFVQEQKVPDEVQFDGNDHISNHYLAFYEDAPCGTARWRFTPAGRIKLERFAVLPEFRKKNVGKALLKAVLGDIPSGFEVFLHAQIEAIAFYQSAGFVTDGPLFSEANIIHQRMVYAKKAKNNTGISSS